MAGKLIRLLSNIAIEEVVDLVKVVWEKASANVTCALMLHAETCGLDKHSIFLQDLPDIIDSVSSPLTNIRTVFQQQSYVTKNLPYVVSLPNHSSLCLI